MTSRPGISLDEWYPLIQPLVDTPKTVIVRAGADMAPLLYAGEEGAPDVSLELKALVTDIGSAAEKVGGFPIFLRTGLMSGKHGWKDTCFVPSASVIAQHVYNIVEYSELADMFGGRPTDVWVVRELLRPSAPFTAFEDMPITRERRYFVVDGKVVGHHPYWPPEAFEIEDWIASEFGYNHNTSTDNWRIPLERLNRELPEEIAHLTQQTEKVGAVLPGAWSVDWLWAQERWWLTDMAWAEQSFVWWDHPHAPPRELWS